MVTHPAPVTPGDGDRVELADLVFSPSAPAGDTKPRLCAFGGRRFLFKRYADARLDIVDEGALRNLIAWRRALPIATRSHLDEVAAWPRYRVCADRSLRGVLIPQAPTQFLSWTRSGQYEPRMLGGLIRTVASGIVRPGAVPAVKLRVFGHAIDVLLWLHSQDVVANDVHARNILCAGDGGAVYFVDCDAMIGAWGAVGPPEAPPYVRTVVPDADWPTRGTDFARLAWVAMWTLLGNFAVIALAETHLAGRLAGIVGEPAAGFLIRAGRARGTDEVPRDEWRRLADEWTAASGTGAGPRAGPPTGVRATAYPAAPGRPRQVPSGLRQVPSRPPPVPSGRPPVPGRPHYVPVRPPRPAEWSRRSTGCSTC